MSAEQLVLRPDPARAMEGRRHAAGTDTERAAARRVAPRSGSQRARVLAELGERGTHGATDYELWVCGIGARPHVPGTRREELIADGWPIVDSGKRRRTDTGNQAIVWVLLDSEPGPQAHSPEGTDGIGPPSAPSTAASDPKQPPGSELSPVQEVLL